MAITRRHLLALLPAATLHAQSRLFPRKPKPRPAAPEYTAFFGTDTTRPGAHGIYSARFNPATGQFTSPTLAAACVRPSYIALNRIVHGGQSQWFLYSVNEGANREATVTTYAISPGPNPTLTQLNQVPSAGDSPCYISVDSTGRSAYVANYTGGTVSTYLVKLDGTLSEPIDHIDFHDKLFGRHGPVVSRQEGPHPHSALLSPDNRFLIVNDLGNDTIVTVPVHLETARLGTPRILPCRVPGSGPRHLAFHPNGRWIYGIDELSNRIDQYLWNATHGGSGLEAEAFLTDVGRSVRTLDADFHGSSTAAEIVVGPAGNFVYVSNRGEDSLVVFAIDPANGALTFTQRISCGGKTPRHFTFDPTGKWLICGNQDSATITVFSCDAANGHLSGPLQILPLDSPVFTLLLASTA